MTTGFLGLEHETLRTHAFKVTQSVIPRIVEFEAMAAFFGDAGLGKTYAVRKATAALGVPAHWLTFPLRTDPRTLVVSLLGLITETAHTGTRARLEPLLVELLSVEPRLIVIDESQRLSYECVEYLRHLWDEPSTHFALALVGGNGTWALLSRYPMLRSRIYRRVPFERIATDELQSLMPRFHDLYRDVDSTLIELIDDEFAHGNLREWASFTHSALSVMAENEIAELTEEVVGAVFELHGGFADAA